MNDKTCRRIAGLLVAIALLTAAVSAVGVFARGDGSTRVVTSARGETYPMGTTGVYALNAQRVVAEGVGWDIFTLAFAAPALLAASAFVARGSLRGRVFALGILGYLFYQYLMYAMTWAFGPLLLPFVAIYALCAVVIVWIASTISLDEAGDTFAPGFPARRIAVLAIGMSALLVLMWVRRIVAGLAGDWGGAMLEGQTTMVVQAMDLGLVVPLSLFVGIASLRGKRAVFVVAPAYLVMFSAMAAAIFAMLLSAWAVEGAPEPLPMAIFAVAGVSAALLCGRLLAPRRESRAPAAVTAAEQ